MAGCIYCVDNDILKKLATFQLFDTTLQLYETTYQDVKILATAKYKFRRSYDKFASGRSRQAVDKIINWERLLELTETLPCISAVGIDESLLIQLSDIDDVDPGEAQLVCQAISLMQKDKSARIFTGDKKFIRALASANLPSVHRFLTHRIFCLEQVVFENIKGVGFEKVRDLIVPVRDCDTAIKVVFGSGLDTSEVNARSALASYITDVRNESNGLLWLE